MVDGNLMLKHGVFDRPYGTQQLFAGGTNEHKNNTIILYSKHRGGTDLSSKHSNS